MFFQPRSLQQRTLFFVLVPTLLLLVALSIGGFVFVREILLNQWGKTAVLKLQLTAHQIDMELGRPKELLGLLQTVDDSDINRLFSNHVLDQIEALDLVVGVEVDWPLGDNYRRTVADLGMNQVMDMMHMYRLDKFEISAPKYNNQLKNRTVSLVSEIKDRNEEIAGRLEVIISFDALIERVINAPWWKSNKAYLLDQGGNVLASTARELELEDYFPMRAFGTVDALEQDTLAALQEHTSGTVFGPGSPPEEISGFYRLAQAPWTMVIVAPGEKVLEPIIRFKLVYFLTFAFSAIVILLFIRQATQQVTARIKEISVAADNLARGDFGPPLASTSFDEVGELTRNFNKMTAQLKQRLALKKDINIAREVQQNLLPHHSLSVEGVRASGVSLYCDETGGDFFDLITFSENDQKVGVVVGDVVGHGIGAALLMTTVRALLRCRLFIAGHLGLIMTDVNRLLCRDTCKSGSFVTLFYLELDPVERTVRWVRAGHDPAIVYNLKTDQFNELKGSGLALGVDDGWNFEYNELDLAEDKQLFLLCTDGAWEVENEKGVQFGQERLKELLAVHCELDPEEILQKITEEINHFKDNTPQGDDITLAVVKTG